MPWTRHTWPRSLCAVCARSECIRHAQVPAGSKGVKIGQLVALTVDEPGEQPVIPAGAPRPKPTPPLIRDSSRAHSAAAHGCNAPGRTSHSHCRCYCDHCCHCYCHYHYPMPIVIAEAD